MMKKHPWPFQYGVIALDKIFVDYGYQRPSLPSFVRWLVEHFDESLVVCLIVSQRADGSYALIDGQQRWHALKKKGYQDVPVLIYSGLSYEEEAARFAAFNFTRKNMQPWYLYRALREAQDATVLDVDAIVEAVGLTVGHSLQGEAMIGAPATLVSIFEGDPDVVRSGALEGSEVLRRTLATITIAWRGWAVSWKEAKTSAMLRGVARWLSVNPTVPAEALARVLRMVEPGALHQSAKQLQAGGSGSGKGRKMEAAIETLYGNHGDNSLREAA